MKNLFHVMSKVANLSGALLIASATSALAFQEEGTVRIGVTESQTGLFAPYGLPGLWGSQIAVEEINEAGGVTIDGKQVLMEITPSPNGYDPAGDPAQNIVLIKRLMNDDQVLMVKGLSASTIGTAVYNYLNELEAEGNPIVVHSSAVGAPGLPGISKWGFRNTFSEVNVVPRVAKAVKEAYDIKTAGFLIMQDNPYFSSIAENAIMPALKELGIEVKVVTEGVSSDRDFTRQVDALRSADVDVVYILAGAQPGVIFMKEARRRGLEPKAFVGGISQLTPDTLQTGSDAVEGMIMAGSYDPASPLMEGLSAKYKERFGRDLNLFAVNGYEAMYLIKNAIEISTINNTPETLKEDREKLRDALADASIISVTGEEIKFDDVGDTPKVGVILHIKDGAFQAWPGAE